MRPSIIVCLALALAGCSSTAVLSEEQKLSGHYGAVPVDYEETVKDYIKDKIFNPESARFVFLGEPYRGYTREAPMSGGDPDVFGYVIEVAVDTRSLVGNYTGPQLWRVLMRDGVVVDRIAPNDFFDEPWFQ